MADTQKLRTEKVTPLSAEPRGNPHLRPIPYTSYGGTVYDFDIPRISDEKQLKLIKDASLHEKSPTELYTPYEQDGKFLAAHADMFRNKAPIGYCGDRDCRAKHKHAVPGSLQYCADHLAVALTLGRFHSTGTSIFVEFRGTLEGHETVPASMLVQKPRVEFTPGATFLTWQGGPRYRVDGSLEETTDGYVLVLNDPLTVNNKVPTGRLEATLQGRHVCKNLAHGHKCLSMEPDYSPKTFIERCTPRGVPGWREHTARRIEIWEYCPPCLEKLAPLFKARRTLVAEDQAKKATALPSNVPSVIAEPVSTTKSHDPRDQLIAEMQQHIQQLMTNNNELQMKVFTLQAELARRQ